jgi:SEC-C motif domain protein
MRSRFAAFSLGLGDYLFDTLASTHPDTAQSRAEAVRELSRIRERRRFMRLAIDFAVETEVLFRAGIFEKGADLSFAELSTFVREEGSWRYASGIAVPAAAVPSGPIDRAEFLAIAESLGAIG